VCVADDTESGRKPPSAHTTFCCSVALVGVLFTVFGSRVEEPGDKALNALQRSCAFQAAVDADGANTNARNVNSSEGRISCAVVERVGTTRRGEAAEVSWGRFDRGRVTTQRIASVKSYERRVSRKSEPAAAGMRREHATPWTLCPRRVHPHVIPRLLQRSHSVQSFAFGVSNSRLDQFEDFDLCMYE
jgi:hypothetical protein